MTPAPPRRWLRPWPLRLALALLVLCAVRLAESRWSAAGRLLQLHPVQPTAREGPAALPFPASRQLTVAAVNLAHGRGPTASNFGGGGAAEREVRLRAVGRMLREQGVDVAVLCEADFDSFWSGGANQAALVAEEAGLRHRFEMHTMQAALPFLKLDFGTAVISRYPLRDPALLPFPARSTWRALLIGHKEGGAVTVAPPDGPAFVVHATHLEHQGERWRLRAAEVMERWIREQPLPVVAAGDFNSTQVGFPTPYAADAPRTAVSALSDDDGPLRALPEGPPTAAQLTFPAASPDRVIDWILFPPSWQPLDYRVLPVELADHRPVIARFRLPPP